MKDCCECKEEIRSDAKRCMHCGTAQNWLRYVTKSAVLSTSFLTLVSIWAAQPIKDAINPTRADINVSILDSDFGHMTFMLSNTGNRPAGLAQIEIESPGGANYITSFLRSNLDHQLMEPGRAYVVSASNGTAIPEAVPPEILGSLRRSIASKPNCRLVLQYVQMSGQKEYLYYPFVCSPIAPS